MDNLVESAISAGRSEKRRFRQHVVAAIGFYVLGFIGLVALGNVDRPPMWLAVLFTLLVAAGFGYIVFLYQTRRGDRDNVERYVNTEAAALGFWAIIGGAAVWSGLHLAFGSTDDVPPSIVVAFGVTVYVVVRLIHNYRLGLRR